MTETRRPETAQASTGLWKKAGIALLLLAAFGTAYYFGYRKSAHKYDAFARCLTDRQVKMYGAYWCPHCAEQKEMFGESFALAPYVECGVAGDRRAGFCRARLKFALTARAQREKSPPCLKNLEPTRRASSPSSTGATCPTAR